MPADTNQNGDIFGGWLLEFRWILQVRSSLTKTTQSRNVTVAIEAMTFRKPVFVGDVVSVYGSLVRLGDTSITVHLDAWVQRRNEAGIILVTDGNYTYGAVDDQGHPQVIRRDQAAVSV